MSSPANDKKVPGWRQPWDTWRIMMFAGAIVLLLLAFTRAGGRERLPDWLFISLQFGGYALLAIGFFLAMRLRREIKERRESEMKAKKKKKP